MKKDSKKSNKKDLTEAELNESMQAWSRKYFGYMENGKYCRD